MDVANAGSASALKGWATSHAAAMPQTSREDYSALSNQCYGEATRRAFQGCDVSMCEETDEVFASLFCGCASRPPVSARKADPRPGTPPKTMWA